MNEDQERNARKAFVHMLTSALVFGEKEEMSDVEMAHNLLAISIGLIYKFTMDQNGKAADISGAEANRAAVGILTFIVNSLDGSGKDGFNEILRAGDVVIDGLKEHLQALNQSKSDATH